MTKEELNAQVQVVAEARARSAVAKAQMTSGWQEWADAHIELFQARENADTILALAESLLKEMAVQHYNETGQTDKQPVPGVVIRVETKLTYLDSLALAWAKEHGLALKPEALDSKEFEKLARVTEIPFVTKTPTPAATLAAKLPEVVEE